MKALALLALLLALLGCGDNIVPVDAPPDTAPLTWRYAEEVWADAWCSYAQRCFPGPFAARYGTHDYCVTTEVEWLCDLPARIHPCPDPFPPERLGWLEQCHAEMLVISCSATAEDVPTTCLAAFQ